MHKMLLFAILLFCVQAFAFQSRDEFGLGFTDNATYASSDKKSDAYWKLTSNDNWNYRDQKILFRGGYRDFLKVQGNDLLFWKIGDKFPVVYGWTLYTGLFGNHYIHQSPGITDEAFSNQEPKLKAKS